MAAVGVGFTPGDADHRLFGSGEACVAPVTRLRAGDGFEEGAVLGVGHRVLADPESVEGDATGRTAGFVEVGAAERVGGRRNVEENRTVAVAVLVAQGGGAILSGAGGELVEKPAQAPHHVEPCLVVVRPGDDRLAVSRQGLELAESGAPPVCRAIRCWRSPPRCARRCARPGRARRWRNRSTRGGKPLLGQATSSATVDALVVAQAVVAGGAHVLTGDPNDLEPLAARHPEVEIQRL